jgi:hypothetical protein
MLAAGARQLDVSNEYEIDFSRRGLRIVSAAAPAGRHAFEILEIPAQSAGGLVANDESIDRTWSSAVVLENPLPGHIVEIGTALGEHREFPPASYSIAGDCIGLFGPRMTVQSTQRRPNNLVKPATSALTRASVQTAGSGRDPSVPTPAMDFSNLMGLESAIALGSNSESSITPQILRICMPMFPAS